MVSINFEGLSEPDRRSHAESVIPRIVLVKTRKAAVDTRRIDTDGSRPVNDYEVNLVQRPDKPLIVVRGTAEAVIEEPNWLSPGDKFEYLKLADAEIVNLEELDYPLPGLQRGDRIAADLARVLSIDQEAD